MGEIHGTVNFRFKRPVHEGYTLLPPPHGPGGLLRFGTTDPPAAWARWPPSLWDHSGPRCMGEVASVALGSPRPPPHGREGLLRFGTTEAPAAWARGPPLLWDHRGPRRTGEGASFALGPLKFPAHERGGLLRFGTTEVPAAWVKGPPSLWDHRGPLGMGERASFALGPLRPRPHGRGVSFALGPPRPPPHGPGGLLRFVGCSVLGRGAEPLVRTQFPEHPPTLNFGANHLKKWIQHPQKTPIPFLSPHNPHCRGGFLGGGQRVRAQLEQS